MQKGPWKVGYLKSIRYAATEGEDLSTVDVTCPYDSTMGLVWGCLVSLVIPGSRRIMGFHSFAEFPLPRLPRDFRAVFCAPMVKWRQEKSVLDQGDAYTSSNEKHERIMNELTGVLWVPVERRPKIDQTAEAYQGFRHWMRNRMCPDCRPHENLPFIFLAA